MQSDPDPESELDRLLRKGEPKIGWLQRLRRWWRNRAPAGDSRSANGLLERVRGLRREQAGWPRILSVVNPRNDRVAAALLTQLRGPHQFAPHVALSVLEAACERVMASGRRASEIDALREAARQTDRITR